MLPTGGLYEAEAVGVATITICSKNIVIQPIFCKKQMKNDYFDDFDLARGSPLVALSCV